MSRGRFIFITAAAVLIFCRGGLLHCAVLDDAEIVDLFSQAKQMFRQANELADTDPDNAHRLYRKSVMRFERIVRDGGIKNGKLYYNIGNAYFKMNDIGRAILNYRRAEAYIPNDGNLKQNLQYARSLRLDKLKEREKTRILKTLFFWHYDIPVKVRFYISVFSFAALWMFASIRIFARHPFTGWCILISVLLALLFSGSLAVEEICLRNDRPGVIISTEVIARKGNSDTYEQSFKDPLHAGLEFKFIEERGAWYYIELPDSRTCWVPSADVDLVMFGIRTII